jgi:predicted nucleic acid-binding protein
MSKIIISDTSCLIILDKIGQLDLLQQLFETVVITPEIQEEFGEVLPDWITVQNVQNSFMTKVFSEQVDLGEASAIALALEHSEHLLIIDDNKGRKLAKSLELNFTGTLGILVKAKKEGIIPLLKPILEQIEQTDFRISNKLKAIVLKQISE